MRLVYSGRSAPSAFKIADAAAGDIEIARSSQGDVNWGRATANTKLNPDTSNCTNKRKMRELFKEHNVPMPTLYSFDYVANQFGGGRYMNLIGRPDTHTKGRGLWHITCGVEFWKAVNGTRRKKAATHFMEYIESDREYRVHIFQGKSIRISQKEFFIDENGKKDYTTGKPGEIKVRRVREAAKQAVEALGLDFGAVDILARGDDNAEVFVLEVNAAPGLGGSMPKLYSEVFLKWQEEE